MIGTIDKVRRQMVNKARTADDLALEIYDLWKTDRQERIRHRTLAAAVAETAKSLDALREKNSRCACVQYITNRQSQ